MKITVPILVGLVIGCVIYNTRNEAMLTSAFKDAKAAYAQADDRYYVGIKFAKTGKLLVLSDKFENYNDCISSSDYHIHTTVAKESGSNIICTNQKPDYNL